MNNVKELMAKHGAAGVRFQKQLADFIFENKLETIVETGSGVSTLYILEALDKLGKGHLYSIDPFPFCEFEVIHPRYTLIKKKSFEALADLYKQTGAWDLFLHDSDHWIECQMYEYEMARQCVKQGGWIFSDDYEWDAHFAWKRFHEWHKLMPILVGGIQGVQKQSPELIDKKYVSEYSLMEWEAAKTTGAVWRKENNRPPCWSCESGYSEYWKFPETNIA